MEPAENNIVSIANRAGRLAEAVQRARERLETQDEADRARRNASLVALQEELDSIAAELPRFSGEDDERFAMVRSHTGDRLVIDSLAYVDLHPETDAYRLIRHRREGPETVLESSDKDQIASCIADYVAERIVDLERSELTVEATSSGDGHQKLPKTSKRRSRSGGFLTGVGLFFLGAVCSALALFLFAWFSYPSAD